MCVCDECGKKFDEIEARNEFENETNKDYDGLVRTLCAECAIEYIEDGEIGQYQQVCDKCGTMFDPFEAELDFPSTIDDVIDIDYQTESNGGRLCPDCTADMIRESAEEQEIYESGCSSKEEFYEYEELVRELNEGIETMDEDDWKQKYDSLPSYFQEKVDNDVAYFADAAIGDDGWRDD